MEATAVSDRDECDVCQVVALNIEINQYSHYSHCQHQHR